MTTRDKILAYVNKNSPVEWSKLKAQLDYTEYKVMMSQVRGLEKEKLVLRQVGKNADGTHYLRVIKTESAG